MNKSEYKALRSQHRTMMSLLVKHTEEYKQATLDELILHIYKLMPPRIWDTIAQPKFMFETKVSLHTKLAYAPNSYPHPTKNP